MWLVVSVSWSESFDSWWFFLYWGIGECLLSDERISWKSWKIAVGTSHIELKRWGSCDCSGYWEKRKGICEDTISFKWNVQIGDENSPVDGYFSIILESIAGTVQTILWFQIFFLCFSLNLGLNCIYWGNIQVSKWKYWKTFFYLFWIDAFYFIYDLS